MKNSLVHALTLLVLTLQWVQARDSFLSASSRKTFKPRTWLLGRPDYEAWQRMNRHWPVCKWVPSRLMAVFWAVSTTARFEFGNQTSKTIHRTSLLANKWAKSLSTSPNSATFNSTFKTISTCSKIRMAWMTCAPRMSNNWRNSIKAKHTDSVRLNSRQDSPALRFTCAMCRRCSIYSLETTLRNKLWGESRWCISQHRCRWRTSQRLNKKWTFQLTSTVGGLPSLPLEQLKDAP